MAKSSSLAHHNAVIQITILRDLNGDSAGVPYSWRAATSFLSDS